MRGSCEGVRQTSTLGFVERNDCCCSYIPDVLLHLLVVSLVDISLLGGDMNQDEKKAVVIVTVGLVCIQLVYAFRIRRIRQEVTAVRSDLLDHLEEIYQEVVDEAFEEIAEHYDDGY